MGKHLFIALLALLALSCSKGKYDTKPKITYKKVNATALPSTADFVITLEYTDKEGDVGKGILTYGRNRLNVMYPVINKLVDSVDYPIPDFPKAVTGEIELRINAGFLNENPQFNDTVSFSIFIRDVEGNISDTITTPPLVEISN